MGFVNTRVAKRIYSRVENYQFYYKPHNLKIKDEEEFSRRGLELV